MTSPPPPAGLRLDWHPRRPPRYRVALVVVAAVLVTLLLGSVANLRRYTVEAGINLAGLLLVGLVGAATYFLIRAVDRDLGARRRHLVRAGVALALALGLFLLVSNALYAGATLPALLICLPTTGFALWLIRRLDYNEREPWRLVLVAFGWGAVVAPALALLLESLWSHGIDAHLIPGPGAQVSSAFSAALLEEVPKGVALLLLFSVMPDEFDDVVDGIVYGAAVGLGFNYVETVSYMQTGGLFQWFDRQVLGLFLGHATYTALIGAGLGVARQLRGRHQQVAAILAGLTVAIAAHFAWDAWLWYFPQPSDPALLILTILVRPLLITGPFAAVVFALFLLGVRTEGRALRRQLAEEAALADGAVRPEEVARLSGPWARWRTRVAALRAYGPRGYLFYRRLQRAQLALAMERWHRERQESDQPLETELLLRDRVLAIRAGRG